MGKPITVPTGGIDQLIKDAYNMTEKYQWAREAAANALESAASWIFLGVDRQGLTSTGCARRYIADNGHGMTEDQIEMFLSMFGGGGKTIGFDANRGVGLKASAYTWNTYGVVVMSWTVEHPDGVMVWIHQNADGVWEQRDFEIKDEDGEVEDIATIVAPHYSDELQIDFRKFKFKEIERAGHGTVVLFLGDGPTRNTDLGDYSRGETAVDGIAKYLNSRFLNVPDGVTITVEAVASFTRAERFVDRDVPINLPEGVTYPTRGTASGSDETVESDESDESGSSVGTVHLHSRNIKGLREFIPASNPSKFPQALFGTVHLPYRGRTVEVEWAYCPKVPVTSAAGRTSTRIAINGADSYGPGPRIVYRYDQQTKYALLSEAYVSQTHYQAYKRYGFGDLKDGLYLIVHLPEWDSRDPNLWGVMPQQSRAALIGAGGIPDFDVIVQEISDLFYDRAADLKEVVNAELAKRHVDSGDLKDTLKRTIGRLADRMRPTKAFKDAKGKHTGTELDLTDAGPNRRGRKQPAVEPEPNDDTPNLPTVPRDHTQPTGTGSSVQKMEVDITRPTGGVTATKQRQSDGIPTVEWNAEKFTVASIPHLAVMFDAKGDPKNAAGLLTLNPDFGLFQQEIVYWQEHWSKAPGTSVADLVKEVYSAEAASKVTHITKLRVQEFKRADGVTAKFGTTPEYREMLSATVLTAAITGLVNVEQQITTKGGGRFGKAAAPVAPATPAVAVV